MANFHIMYKGHAITVTAEDIDDIVVTALEGGITYWALSAEVVGTPLANSRGRHLAAGGSLRIGFLEPDDDGNPEVILDLNGLLKGLQTWASNGYDHYNALTEEGLDCADIDAEAADAIVQCAIFGDIVYG